MKGPESINHEKVFLDHALQTLKCGEMPYLKSFITFLHNSRGPYFKKAGMRTPIHPLGYATVDNCKYYTGCQ